MVSIIFLCENSLYNFQQFQFSLDLLYTTQTQMNWLVFSDMLQLRLLGKVLTVVKVIYQQAVQLIITQDEVKS